MLSSVKPIKTKFHSILSLIFKGWKIIKSGIADFRIWCNKKNEKNY